MGRAEVSARLIGYVQLHVGGQVVAVPVQAVRFDPDGFRRPGGFYADGGTYGIYVSEGASERDVADQMQRGSLEAFQHLVKKILN